MAAPTNQTKEVETDAKVPGVGINLSQINTAHVMTTRSYSLNIDKTLRKKKLGCEKANLDYEVTGGGITGHMDTATFELFRRSCTSLYSNLLEEDDRCVIDMSQDRKKKAMVQQTYRVRRTVENEEIGYTLNLYPTANKILLNGKDIDAFMDKHLPRIHEIMCRIVRDEELGSVAEYNDMLSTRLGQVLDERNLQQVEGNGGEVSQVIGVNSGVTQVDDNNQTRPKTRGSRNPKAVKEKSGTDEKCFHCKRNVVTRGAECTLGNNWIHYNCDRLTPQEIYRLDTDPGVIYNCKKCLQSNENTAVKTSVGNSVTSSPFRNNNPNSPNRVLTVPPCPNVDGRSPVAAILEEERGDMCSVCDAIVGDDADRCQMCFMLCHGKCMLEDGSAVCLNCTASASQQSEETNMESQQHLADLIIESVIPSDKCGKGNLPGDQLAGDLVSGNGQDDGEEPQEHVTASNTTALRQEATCSQRRRVQTSEPACNTTSLVANAEESQRDMFEKLSSQTVGTQENKSAVQQDKQSGKATKGRQPTTESVSAKQRELRQFETKLKKWEEELKLREAKSSDLQNDVRRLEEYLCRTEARNLELESTIRTLQRKIQLLEGLQPAYPRASGRSNGTTEPDNKERSQQVPAADMSYREYTQGRDKVNWLSINQELICGIHNRVTNFVLGRVEKQLSAMENAEYMQELPRQQMPLQTRSSGGHIPSSYGHAAHIQGPYLSQDGHKSHVQVANEADKYRFYPDTAWHNEQSSEIYREAQTSPGYCTDATTQQKGTGKHIQASRTLTNTVAQSLEPDINVKPRQPSSSIDKRSHNGRTGSHPNVKSSGKNKLPIQTLNPARVTSFTGQPIYYDPQIPPPSIERPQQSFLEMTWPRGQRR